MKRLFLILSLFVFIACDPDEKKLPPTGYMDVSEHIKGEVASLKISADSDEISETEAMNVAKLTGLYKTADTKSESSKEVENVVTITNDAGEAIMYAVNYKHNQGYTLISATKNYYPILAEVPTGQFNENVYNTGASVLLSGYKAEISHVETLPADSISQFRNMWKVYEKQNTPQVVGTKLNEFDTFITNQLQEWSETAHDFYSLENAQFMLPADIYQYFCSVAQGVAHPEYDYMTYSYVVETIDRIDYDEDDYLLTTLWDQLSPYNYSCYLGLGQYDTLGCGAVAMGQIMKYHQWPNLSWSWNSMPNQLSISTIGETPLSQFLYSVALKIQTDGYPLNYSYISDVYDSFRNDYDYSCSLISHSKSKVITSISNSRPVYMVGYTTDGSIGHSWVCDGYGFSQQRIVYTLYVIATSHTLEYVSACDPSDGDILSAGNYFHMNWGWGGRNNGWFVDGPYATNVNGYSEGRQDIVDIRKNN